MLVISTSDRDNFTKFFGFVWSDIFAKKSEGIVLPLHILLDGQKPIFPDAKIQQNQLLGAVEAIAHAAVTAYIFYSDQNGSRLTCSTVSST